MNVIKKLKEPCENIPNYIAIFFLFFALIGFFVLGLMLWMITIALIQGDNLNTIITWKFEEVQ